MQRSLVLGLTALALTACVAQPADEDSALSSDATATTYVDTADYWKTSADQSAWHAMQQKLDGEFYDVCGDTFCGGDYSNLTSLGLTCSVTAARGSVHECVWAFTGSSHLVNGGTGTVEASVASFQCRFQLKTSARALLNLLGPVTANDPSLHRALPGTTLSLYDEIGECFQNPIGATPISQGTGSTYSDARDANGADVDGFDGAERTLQSNFNDVCGDTFCGGDYSNLQALRLACSVRATTDTIRDCKWLFAGSYDTIDAKTGAITVHPKSYQCTVPVTGTANAFAAFLNADGATKPINRVLPGSTKSAYDVLLNCL